MDAAELTILLREFRADCEVIREAAEKAKQRSQETGPGHFEACAYELARFYNTLERMLERLCGAFENHLEPRGDYHERLLQRLSLDLEGLRPAFLPRERLPDLRELKGFRHVVRHAYDLRLKPERLVELALQAEQVAAALPQWCEVFARRVRSEQGWSESLPFG